MYVCMAASPMHSREHSSLCRVALWAVLHLGLAPQHSDAGGGTRAGGGWRAPFRHEWTSLEQQSFDFGNNPTGFDDAQELKLKSRYSVVFLDAGTGTGGPSIGYGHNCCNSSLPFGGPECHSDCDYVKLVREQANALKKVAHDTSAWIYTSAFCTSTTFNSLSRIVDDPVYSGFWTDCVGSLPGNCPSAKGGTRAWDFRNASARAYFAKEWGTNIAEIPELDGVYADSGDMTGCSPGPSASGHTFTQSEMEALFNGTVLAWRELTLELNKAQKYFTVSLKNQFPSMPVSPQFPSEGSTCKGGLQNGRTTGGEDIIFELMGDVQWSTPNHATLYQAPQLPFRQYNIPSKDFGKDAIGCVSAIENVAIESARGPTFICCNDANKTADGGAGLNVSLAAYLMNANDDSYFGPGSHWANDGWDGVFEAFPQLTRPLGPPKGTFRKTSEFTFYRQFEHLDVALDCHPDPGCAGHKTEIACGREQDCEWMKQWTPVGSAAKGVCTDPPVAKFSWR